MPMGFVPSSLICAPTREFLQYTYVPGICGSFSPKESTVSFDSRIDFHWLVFCFSNFVTVLIECVIQFIMVIGLSARVQFGLQSYEWLTKSDKREAGVWYLNHKYDYRQNWMTQSPVTN